MANFSTDASGGKPAQSVLTTFAPWLAARDRESTIERRPHGISRGAKTEVEGSDLKGRLA